MDQHYPPTHVGEVVRKSIYTSPKLAVFGNVHDLTQGNTSRTNDPGGSQNGKSS